MTDDITAKTDDAYAKISSALQMAGFHQYKISRDAVDPKMKYSNPRMIYPPHKFGLIVDDEASLIRDKTVANLSAGETIARFLGSAGISVDLVDAIYSPLTNGILVVVDTQQRDFAEKLAGLPKQTEYQRTIIDMNVVTEMLAKFSREIPLNANDKPVSSEQAAKLIANGVNALTALASQLGLDNQVNALSSRTGAAVPTRGGEGRPVARGD